MYSFSAGSSQIVQETELIKTYCIVSVRDHLKRTQLTTSQYIIMFTNIHQQMYLFIHFVE